MAYNGYGAERPYAGPAAPRAPQRGGHGGQPPPARAIAPAEQYDGYGDNYGYNEYNNNGGYGQQSQQNYGDPNQNPDYSRGAPPQPRRDPYDSRNGRGGRPPPGSRGGYGPPHRGRGGMGPGRSGGRPPQADHYDQGAGRHARDPQMSPRDTQQGAQYGYRGEMDQMANQMSGMDLNGQGRGPPTSRPGGNDYGRPPANGRMPARDQQQGYFDPRRGVDQGQQQGGYGEYDNSYGSAPPSQRTNQEFGPPARSMTMPNDPSASRNMQPRRMNTTTYQDPAGRGMPQRPMSAEARGPPPQHGYPADYPDYYDGYGGGHQGGGYEYPAQQPQAQQHHASYDNALDDYYGGGASVNHDYNSHQKDQSQSSIPNFDTMGTNGRNSFDQAMRPGPEQPQPGAHQKATLNHAKSQPNLHEPQSAVFEMAGDIPDMPPVPPVSSIPPRQNPGYGPSPHSRMPLRGPSAPPGPTGLPGPTPQGPSGAQSDYGVPPSRRSNPDALPSHPTPVRPGLMENSVVNLNSKPPPVRNYNGIPQAQPQPQPQPQQMVPQRQQHPQATPQLQPAPQKPVELPVTPQELEHLRQVIKTNPNDQESALRLAKRLIEAADVLLPNIPDPKVRGRARERYVMDAHKILKKLSNAQNIEAMFIMADALGRGLFGGDSDVKEAFTLYQSAAKLGHPAAAYRTAVCCEIGQDEGGGTRKDPMKAIQWYKRAASLGDVPAMYKVGMILLKGLLGQPKNPREAIGWLKRASERADAENPHALHELGLLYESAQPNDAIVRDERYALSLFQMAADLGYKFSQFRLGCAFEYGLMGCPVDPRMSIVWYSKAAQREEHQSELALSGWYLTGSDGVLQQSDQEAYLWARKAAVAGLAKAEYAMGYFTETGIGVAPNLDDAKRWYWRAAAQDFPKARERLDELKRNRNGSGAPRPRERISRSRMEKQQEGECRVM